MNIAKRSLLKIIASISGGVGITALAIPFIRALFPSARTKVAAEPVIVDVSRVHPGEQITVQWRGMPVWILRRTDAMIEGLKNVEEKLRDPDSNVTGQQPDYAKNQTRSINPEYFVCIGLCTHLGCIPAFRPEISPSDLGKDWPGGYFCPCHGSRFDLAGRVYKGVPAPTNLVVPAHTYSSQSIIKIGEGDVI